MEERDHMTPFQQFLVDAYLDYEGKKRRKVSDNEFARWLGVNTGSFNAWINGSRTPDFANTFRLSEKLGPEVFDLLGFPRVLSSRDQKLRFIAEFWESLDSEMQNLIYDHVREEVAKKK